LTDEAGMGRVISQHSLTPRTGRAATGARVALVSVHGRFVRGLLSGSKGVELRRVRPALQQGDVLIIYETQPTCALVAWARVACVVSASREALRRMTGSAAGTTRQEFFSYFRGCPLGHAIFLSSCEPLAQPVSLETLRAKVPGFTPPQSMWYLTGGEERPKDAAVLRLVRRAMVQPRAAGRRAG
jgi:predicted transcriptional regulator